MSVNAPKGWIRFALMNEKSIILRNRNSFHGIVIPANIFAMYRNAIESFIREIKKPYFIDPMTYIFLEDHKVISRSKGNIKKSFNKLTEQYPPSESVLVGPRMRPEERSPDDWRILVDIVCNLSLKSQLPDSSRRKGRKSLKRIRSDLGKTEMDSTLPYPEFLLTPYFRLDEISDSNLVYIEWINSVKRFETITREFNIDMPIYTALSVNPQVLSNDTQVTKLLNDLESPSGLVIWVDDFEKGNPNENVLEGLKILIRGMKEKGTTEIVSLYGGYFTAMYWHYGLDGLSYGLSFGDSKLVSTASSGGGTPSRYYDPLTHTFQTVSNMYDFLTTSVQNSKRMICQCPACKSVSAAMKTVATPSEAIKNLEQLFYPKGNDMVMNWYQQREHFLYTRQKELDHIGSSTIGKLADESQKTSKYLTGADDTSLKRHTLELFETLMKIDK